MFLTLASAQVTGYQETYNDGDINTWYVGEEHLRTFQLSVADSALNINYTRTASSDQWDNFNFTPPNLIDVTSKPLISIKIRSTVNTILTLKPIFENGTDDWIQKNLIGDNSWRTISFEMNPTGSLIINRIYCYLDGGTTTLKEGVVQFDNFSIGDSAFITVDPYRLEKAISQTQALLLNTTEGAGEGEFPSGSKAFLETALNTAQQTLNNEPEDQGVLDQAVWDLYDACVNLEKSVHAPETGLVDSNATKETHYLYSNLVNLSNSFLLFGMQDATGYGVGWSGDDDRSDVKDVSGDFPAVYSEEMRSITRDNGYDRLVYRLTTAYNRGGVATMCWHQYDPLERGFYQQDVNYERIVETILPGGEHHQFYKDKLRKVALFFKSLRGEKGESVPVIFRPYHEHTGDWFWWGPAHCTKEEFNAIWQFTFNYLHDSLNVHNLIWAISPSFQHVGSADSYFNIYPGDEYVDIFGGDKYFHSNPIPESEKNQFLAQLQNIAAHSTSRNKIAALTETGNEGVVINNWYTEVLLAPFVNDEIATAYSYAAVWRNAGTTHHFAPYPGHSSVPDFLNFYNNPYTMFEQDLPEMYSKPEDDITSPIFTSDHDTTLIATSTNVLIVVQTNERAYLRFSYVDAPYDSMPNDFETGQGQFNHETIVPGLQGETKTIFVRASDVWGNKTNESTAITFTVDTTQAPVKWTDVKYPVTNWSVGAAPLGIGTSVNTQTQNVRTIYFRQTLDFEEIPGTLAILVKSQGGAVVYVNNYEIERINLPVTGEINYVTSPTTDASFNKIITLSEEDLQQFKSGENVISVEIHMPEGSAIESFDSQIFDQFGLIIPLGSDWVYFDLGYEPPEKKLGDIVGISPEDSYIPGRYYLYQNYPNPFNPSTKIKYEIKEAGIVTIEIYNTIGQKVHVLKNGFESPGFYEAAFNASDLTSGIYIYVLKINYFKSVRKMLFLK